MTRASGGALSPAPTASIVPLRITRVAFSRTGPDTGRIRAPTIAYTGSRPARAGPAAAATPSPRTRIDRKGRMSLLGFRARGWEARSLLRVARRQSEELRCRLVDAEGAGAVQDEPAQQQQEHPGGDVERADVARWGPRGEEAFLVGGEQRAHHRAEQAQGHEA